MIVGHCFVVMGWQLWANCLFILHLQFWKQIDCLIPRLGLFVCLFVCFVFVCVLFVCVRVCVCAMCVVIMLMREQLNSAVSADVFTHFV